MQTALNFYHSVPTSVWAVIAAAISVSGIIQVLKHKFFNSLSPSALVSITTVVSFLASALQWFSQQVHANPGLLGQHTIVVFGASTLAYRFLVGPVYNLLLDGQKYRSQSSAAIAPSAPTASVAPAEAGF